MNLPTCQELLDFLSDYLADELPAQTRTTFDEHLCCCVACRDYLEDFRTTVQSVKSLSGEMRIEPMPEALVQAILSSRAREEPRTQ